jgi:ribosome-associated protein
MADATQLRIGPGVTIPASELRFQASRSGGPGGQHVNTASTRIELWWDAAGSPSIPPARRDLMLSRLRSRLTEDGLLRVVAADRRSQAQNRALAIERFCDLLARAVEPPVPRKRTRPPRAAKEQRLAGKRHHSERKRERRRPRDED